MCWIQCCRGYREREGLADGGLVSSEEELCPTTPSYMSAEPIMVTTPLSKGAIVHLGMTPTTCIQSMFGLCFSIYGASSALLCICINALCVPAGTHGCHAEQEAHEQPQQTRRHACGRLTAGREAHWDPRKPDRGRCPFTTTCKNVTNHVKCALRLSRMLEISACEAYVDRPGQSRTLL